MGRKFQPYNIYHCQVGGSMDAVAPQGPAVVYMWWQEIPLGHFWIDEPIVLQAAAYRKLVVPAIKPAIEGYLKDAPLLAPLDWEALVIGNNKEAQNQFFAALLTEHLLSNQPAFSGTISVVICTRNRAPQLEKCIKALANGTDPDFELIIVDNAPDDSSTKQVVEQFSFCKYVLEPRKGLDIARNTGAHNAQYPIVAYTDDDVQIEPGWVAKLKRCFANPQVMAVTGQVFPVSLGAPSQYTFERHWGFNKGYQPILFDHQFFLEQEPIGVPAWDVGAGANMAFRKEVFQLAGYFDERLDVGAAGCSGDSEYWYRILAEGWGCYYCPQLFVYHDHRASDAALNNQIFHYMRGHVASLLVQYENYGHQGNLTRLYKKLPKLYIRHLARWVLKRHLSSTDTTLLEIKGCISGHRFYKQVQHQRRVDEPIYNPLLAQPTVVHPQTLVSIIITCYNYGRYLGSAIESALAQSWSHIEVIVVDDGSTDDSAEVAAKYASVQYVRVHRVGLSAARNIGVRYSKGSFVAFLDADDWLYPNAVELNLHYFDTYPESVFVSGGHDKYSAAGTRVPNTPEGVHAGNNYHALLAGNYIGMEATVLYRREVFFTFHFNTQLDKCEDYDLNLRITKKYPTYSYPEKVAGYRLHGANMSANKGDMLQAVVRILDQQAATAETEEERKQIELGKKNWQAYYSTEH
jgi:glycosyltransferase involved in cell wall biosynthesis